MSASSSNLFQLISEEELKEKVDAERAKQAGNQAAGSGNLNSETVYYQYKQYAQRQRQIQNNGLMELMKGLSLKTPSSGKK